MSKIKVIINEQHNLLSEQRQILDAAFGAGDWEVVKVPKDGWNLDEIENLDLGTHVCFVSPVPALIMRLQGTASFTTGEVGGTWSQVFLLHNDRREKVELPDGRIISRVAKTGWQLVEWDSQRSKFRKWTLADLVGDAHGEPYECREPYDYDDDGDPIYA